MKERCDDCRGLEEDIYWTHFQSMKFCQFLTGDFHSQLVIPERFSEKMRGNLNQNLIIRGPSGTTWDVKLAEIDDVLSFGAGWEEFVDAHSLAEKDILIFNYKGNSEFDVLIFGGNSLCEKETSYFVRKCGHMKAQDESKSPRTLEEIIQEHSPKDFESTPIDSARKGKKALVVDSESEDQNSQSKDNEIGIKETYTDEPEFDSGEKRKNPSQIWEKVNLPGSRQTPLMKRKDTTNCPSRVSNRRPVTESEKFQVLKKASEELSESSFLVALRATHVYKKFFLSLPVSWMTKNISKEKQDVILRTKEGSWPTRLIFSSLGHGGLSRGWKIFATDNRLEEFDVCVFKLASQNKKPIVMDVSIFRVTPDEVVANRTRLISEVSGSHGGSSMGKRKYSQIEE